ncbi:MAG: cation diffusion facilitator family transporter [Bdellovibrionales bacterium]
MHGHHSHGHHHHHHGHGADHRHHDHTSAWEGGDLRLLTWAIGLNIVLVLGEYTFGWLADSLALMADATHNLSDVMSLILAWIAMHLARKRPDPQFTYGLGGGTIMASLVNGIILLVIAALLGWAAFERFQVFLGREDHAHAEISTDLMIWVAAAAAILNIITALLFHRSQAKDLNLRGVYIHMMADAAVSVGVIVAALGISATGWKWIDPAFTLLIVVALVYATYSLLMESFRLILSAVPRQIEANKVKAYLESLPGVTAVHDFHVWALSTREVALTAHLVIPAGHPGDKFLADTAQTLAKEYGIVHSTLQIETSPHEVPCGLDGHTH